MNVCRLLAAAAVSMLSVTNAHAIILGFDPESVEAGPSSSVLVDLVAQREADDSVLGAYDLDIVFDTAALSFDSATVGAGLGGDGFLFFAGLSSTAALDIADISTEALATLEALQTDQFVLATLQFTVLALAPNESTVVEINGADPLLFLADDGGVLGTFAGPTLNDFTVTAPDDAGGGGGGGGGGTDVPEPETLALALAALGIVALGRKRSRRE